MEIRTVLLACLIELENELKAQTGQTDPVQVPRTTLLQRFTERHLTAEDFDVDLYSALREGDVAEVAPSMFSATAAGQDHYRRMVKGTSGPKERA